MPGFLPLLRPDLVPRTNGASTIVAASGSATSQGEQQCLLAELCWAMPAVCGQFGQLALGFHQGTHSQTCILRPASPCPTHALQHAASLPSHYPPLPCPPHAL